MRLGHQREKRHQHEDVYHPAGHPALHGQFLQDCPTPGKGGVPLQKYGGFALETQHFPCSPSHPEFPTTILRAGKVFRANTTLRFFTGRQCGRL
ncbi:MAG: hypothetical protein ACLUFL_09610 [Flavonifractor plautii]